MFKSAVVRTLLLLGTGTSRATISRRAVLEDVSLRLLQRRCGALPLLLLLSLPQDSLLFGHGHLIRVVGVGDTIVFAQPDVFLDVADVSDVGEVRFLEQDQLAAVGPGDECLDGVCQTSKVEKRSGA